MILRDSEFKGNGTDGAVLEWAQEGKGNEANGFRAGFIELVRKAQALKSPRKNLEARNPGKFCNGQNFGSLNFVRGFLDSRLKVFRRFGGGDGLGAHGEERADEQNCGAEQLGVGETFMKNDRGKTEGADGAKQLKRLSKSDADLVDGYVIQNVGKRDATDGGNDQDEIDLCIDVQRSSDSSKRKRERQQQCRCY